MTTTPAASAAPPKFDNQGQYSRTSILRYEKIFGDHYISTGGAATTNDLWRASALRSDPAYACSTWAAASAVPPFTWSKPTAPG